MDPGRRRGGKFHPQSMNTRTSPTYTLKDHAHHCTNRGSQAMLCKQGPARMRPLRAVQTTLGGLLWCPHASRYGGGVTASPTEAAEDEKLKRFGPRVAPMAFSTYGRLGREWRKRDSSTGSRSTLELRQTASEVWLQNGEPRWSRACCTRKQTCSFSPLAPRDARDGKDVPGYALAGSAQRLRTRTNCPMSRWQRSKQTESSPKPGEII